MSSSTALVATRRRLQTLVAIFSLAPLSVLAAADDLALVDAYCVGCHNLEDFSGGIAFELLDRNQPQAEAETWEKVLRKLKAGMMPPPGEDRPAPQEQLAFVHALESALDADAAGHPDPGAPLLRRLTRTEYRNAIRDLLDLPLDTTTLMPADDSSGGFDNVANVLSVSPALLEAYVSTASRVSRMAVGDLETVPGATSYRGDGQSQAQHKQGLALGTRGGISVDHIFPLDATYEISFGRGGAASAFALSSFGDDDPVEVALDGERIALLQPTDSTTLRLPVSAGQHRLEVAYLPRSSGLGVDDLHDVWSSSTSITNLNIRGPLDATGRGDTAARRRIFSCRPESVEREAPCAEEILRTLATRAYRRPVSVEALDVLMSFYRRGRETADFDTGIQYALSRLLSDPQFIFRFEAEPDGVEPGSVWPVDDFELASRLSFFLWSSIPDDELLDLAGSGRLADAATLQAQVLRMLEDPKAQALVDNFASQWLSLPKLASVNPVSTDFDGALREAMLQETRLFFADILQRDASIISFLDADYTFVNERLAKHYGMPGIRGSHFRRVSLNDSERRGLLGHGSILTITSAPNRTSPVIRGTWVLENMLATAPPPPPPGVETNLEASVPGAQALSVRAQLERHRAEPACSSCHNVIDPLGFALENYDAVGKWRDSFGGEPVDVASQLWDGSAISGPDGLRAALLERQDLFVEAFTEKLLTYALGRRVDYADMPAIRDIGRKAVAGDYRFSSIVQAIVQSAPFRLRSVTEKSVETATQASRN